MAKQNLPSIDGTATQQPKQQQDLNPQQQHAPITEGYQAQLIAWSRIEVKRVPIGLRKALCAKMCEAQMAGARLSNGSEVKDKRGLLIWLLENALAANTVRRAD